MSRIIIDDPVVGIAGFIDALIAIIAIALGILVGVRIAQAAQMLWGPLSRSARR